MFNIMVSNTDDHLRNHGFLLEPRAGWHLSPVFDVNPMPGSRGLALNIDEVDNALDLELARSVAAYFRVASSDATTIIDRVADAVGRWRELATELGLSRGEQDAMADAFRS